MKKKFSIVTILIMMSFVLLTGCGSKLASDFDQKKVEEAAKSVIQMINAKDSEGLRNMCIPEVSAVLTDEVFSQIYSAIDAGGTFKEIKDVAVAGTKDKNTDEDFATVVAKAEYEKRSFTYTITFTKDMKLAGLYYK